ncbi:HAD family hydrolase [Schnuerera ultunensis]
MSKYKGIIFDLDGTLLNTIEDISDSMNEVLRGYS